MMWFRKRPSLTPEQIEEYKATAEAIARAKPGEYIKMPDWMLPWQANVLREFAEELRRLYARQTYQRQADGIYLTSI